MEWVETTGRTLEEAKDAALDQLGVDEDDAEFEIVEEPKSGLFGRLRSEARVRARVRPTAPRPKDDRRDRRRRKNGDRGARSATQEQAPPVPKATSAPAERPAQRRERRPARPPAAEAENARAGGEDMEDDLSLAEQGEIARQFVTGLVEAFGARGDIAIREIDEETLEIAVDGDDLGLLIGPKGQTLQAVQELTRTVVQRKVIGRPGRLLVDVGGYRERRRAALERFSRQVADEVLRTGERRVLEPMSPADRKTVHDTVNDLDGVETTSEGEEPRRRVVILPTGGR